MIGPQKRFGFRLKAKILSYKARWFSGTQACIGQVEILKGYDSG